MPKLSRTEEMARDLERTAAVLEAEAAAMRRAADALRRPPVTVVRRRRAPRQLARAA